MLSVTWKAAAANADGTPIQAGEITGYEVGIRPESGTPGTYPKIVSVASQWEAANALAALDLPMGNYAAAIRTTGPSDSAWSTETMFTVMLIPKAPGDFRIQLTLPSSV